MISIPGEVDKQSNQYRVTFAEEENSADFFGMPSSAIQTGCVDFILAPSDIAQGLIGISRHHSLQREKDNLTGIGPDR